MKLTDEKLKKIHSADFHRKWEWDNIFQGLLIMAKYIDTKKSYIIRWQDHYWIFSVSGEELIDAWLTEEDAFKIFELNWSYNDWYFYCFT